MGVFYTPPRFSPAIRTAIEMALLVNPSSVENVKHEAAHRAIELTDAITPTFHRWRFAGALAIAAALLWMSIWTAQHDLPDISKTLMDSFSGFCGLALGLLGAEAQRTSG
jgi:hypothetical protein